VVWEEGDCEVSPYPDLPSATLRVVSSQRVGVVIVGMCSAVLSSMTAPPEPRQPAASVLGGLRQRELLTRIEPITSMGG